MWQRRKNDLGPEIESYLEHETDRLIEQGMTEAAARQAARRKFGNVAGVKEEVHEMNRIRWMESLWQDVRHGARQVRLNPGFAAAAILSLALGIGANTAIFQLLDAVRLRGLPVPHPQELVQVRIEGRGLMGNFRGRNGNSSNPIWQEFQRHQQALQAFAFGDTTFNLAPSGEVRNVEGLWVSGSFFPALGVTPVAGRLFTPDDDRRGCGYPGAVISYAMWQREFGGSPEVLTKTLPIDNHSVPVIGVTPPGFFGVEVGRRFDVALPVCSAGSPDDRMLFLFSIMGRRKSGWPMEKTRVHLESISAAVFDATVPPYTPGDQQQFRGLKLVPAEAASGVSALRERYQRPLIILMGMVVVVLLIACANVANMMLARATARGQEFAIRRSIGASRGRLLRQLLTESLVLATLGGLAGTLLAGAMAKFLVAQLVTPRDPIFLNVGIDWRILAFTAGLSCLATVLFGVAPGLHAAQSGSDLRSGGRGITAGREKLTLRRILLAAQVALCLVLLAGASLFVRSFSRLSSRDPGFRAGGILVANTFLPAARYPVEGRQAAVRTLSDRLRGIPGVTGVARAYVIPMSGSSWDNGVRTAHSDHVLDVFMNSISANYFEVLGIPLLAGRTFNDGDTPASTRIAIINETFARQGFPGEDPIGKTFQLNGQEPAYQIAGIARNSIYGSLREEYVPTAYFPATQETQPRTTVRFVLRSAGAPEALIPGVKRVLAEMDSQLVVRFVPLETQIKESILRERLMATLSGFFGILAAVLAVVGLDGVVSYMVERRRSEIGVRMALGAGRGSILRLILGEIGLLVAAGLAVGLAVALAAGKAIRVLLFGIEPHDPATLAAAAALLAAAGLAAAFLPARRAVNVPPIDALREQ